MKSSLAWLTVLTGVVAAGGCAGLPHVEATLPERYALVREQLVIHSDFPMAAQHRLLEELTAQRYDLAQRLDVLMSDEPIHVYLFKDARRFGAFMRLYHPRFPQRRAFFVETDTRLIVYAHWGDRVAEDLRHEVTHGYLHSVLPNLPLWLDEGMAEYFEVPRGHDGMNHAHLVRLLVQLEQGRWRPDLQRLEQLDSAFAMTADDYAEAWAWVHFMLHGGPEHARLLHGYLGGLRRDGSAEPLSAQLGRLLGQSDAALVEHVRYLAAAAGPSHGLVVGPARGER